MLYEGIIITFSIDYIDIYTHDLLLFFRVLFLPFPKDKKQISRGTDYNIGHCGLIYFIQHGPIIYLVIVAKFFERWLLYIENSIIIVAFISLIFIVTYYWVFMLKYLQHKNIKQHSRVIIFYTGWERWTQGGFNGQADFWYRNSFTV